MALFANDGGGTWSYYIEITAQNAQVDASIDDVYVDLSNMPADFFTNVQDGGADIRVTNSDGTTELAREVVSCDTAASTGELHFDAGGLLSTSSDTTYRIYYGNASATDYAATDTYGRNAVYDADYKMLYHHSEDPSGTAPQTTDHTGNGNDGTTAGSMTSDDLISGLVGEAYDCDGSDDIVDTGIGSLTPPITLEILVRTHNATQDAMLLSNWNGSSNDDLYLRHYGSEGRWQFVPDAAGDIKGGTISADTWTLLHGTLDSESMDLYVDGNNVDTGTGTTATHNSGGNFYVSGRPAGGEEFDGDVSLAAIHTAARSGSWCSTRSNILMDNSTFWSVGTQQTAFVISGTVTDGGGAVENAEVLVVYADDDQLTNATLLGVEQTDASGNWSTAIPSGKVAFATAYHKDASSNLHVSTGQGYLTEGA